MEDEAPFDEALVTNYPKSNKKIVLEVSPYSIKDGEPGQAQTLHISPYGLEFSTTTNYPDGTLLKIHVALPDYWNRKQQLVTYSRIDAPGTFKVLARVVRSKELGKRGKKRLTMVKTLNIDEVDEQVLKNFLQES